MIFIISNYSILKRIAINQEKQSAQAELDYWTQVQQARSQFNEIVNETSEQSNNVNDLNDTTSSETNQPNMANQTGKAETSKKKGGISPLEMSIEERKQRGEKLRTAPAIEVPTQVITSTPELSARKAAEKWWDENIPEPALYDTEVGEVEINRNSIESSLAHRYGQKKLDAITSLVEGFENAVYIGTMPDSRERGVVDHYFAYPIIYNGELNYVFCRAMQDANKNRLYVHEVFVADKIKKGNTLQTAASKPHGGISLYRDILANVLSVDEEVYDRPALSSDTNTNTSGVNSGNTEGVTTPAGNSPTTSTAKGTESVSNKQENKEENEKKSETELEQQNKREVSSNLWKFVNFFNNKYGYNFADEFAFYNWIRKKSKSARIKWLEKNLPKEDVREAEKAIVEFGETFARTNTKTNFRLPEQEQTTTAEQKEKTESQNKTPYILSEEYQKELKATATRRRKELKEVSKVFAEELKNNPDIVIVQSVDDLPKEATSTMSAEELQNAIAAKGWFVAKNGKAYILFENAKDKEDLYATLFHEAVAHKGIKKLLGAVNFNKLCQAVYDAMPEADRERIRAREEYARAKRDKDGNIIEMGSVSQALIADEYMAELAEEISKSKGKTTITEDIVQAIRAFLRKIGIKLKINQNDVRHILHASYTKLKGKDVDIMNTALGKKIKQTAVREAIDNAVRNRLVYHGSGAEFKRFDHNYMGTGEGAQAYGWGTYVTDVEGIGRQYAENPSGNIFKSGFGDFYLKQIRKGLEEGKNFDDIKENLLDYHKQVYDKTGGNTALYGDFISDYNKLKDLKEEDLPKRNLYTVDIPDDNGSNYLHWEEAVPSNVVNTVKERLFEEILKGDKEGLYEGVEKELKKELENTFKDLDIEGGKLYGGISSYLGGDKQASQFLNSLGFVGISYPAQATTGGRADGARNFVIFNEDDAQIVEHTRFRLTQEEQDIISEAQANGTYLKAPNGKGTNLTPEQWARVRTKAFKEWFGDWETLYWTNVISKLSPISLDNEKSLDKKEAEEIVSKLENGKNKYDGRETTWVKSSVGKILRHKGFDSSLLIPKLKEVFDSSVHILSEQEIKKNGHKEHSNFKGYHHYIGKIQLKGKEYYVRFTLQELNTKKKDFIPNQLHSTFVSDIEIYSTNNRVNTGTNPATANIDAKFVDTKLEYFFEKANNSSKIVDENGEPMVMYHGDRKKGRYVFSTDTFFTPSQEYAKRYTNENGEIYDTYLDIRKPFDVRDQKAYDIFTQFNGGRKPVETTSGALDWSQYTYEDLQEYLNENYEGEYDGFILDEGGEYDKDNNVIHRGLSYIPFSPTQIKSATENVGTYDSNNPDIRFRFGGNSGYVGYSMSVRAAQAREEGRYPKTDFLKEYGVSAKALQPLVDAGIISDREWHHTSKFGNKTTFYGWNEEEYADIYQDNKKEIDNLLKLGETENVKSIFDTKLQEYIDAKAEAQAKYMNEVKEYGKYRRENLWIPEEEYQAQNGVKIVTNGSDSPADWTYLYNNKPAFKNYANKAKEELEKVIKEKNSGILSFRDWKSQQANEDGVRFSLGGLNKSKVEKIFGGIWIADREEYAKFMSAINTYGQFGFEEEGEGITYTDDYFYAYYRNIDNVVIPYASVYLNRYESQDIINQVNEIVGNDRAGTHARIQGYIDTAIERAWNVKTKNNDNNGNNQGAQDRKRDDKLYSDLSRKGNYFYHPDLYVKTIPTNGWGEGIDEDSDTTPFDSEAGVNFRLSEETDNILSRIEQESSKEGVKFSLGGNKKTLSAAALDKASNTTATPSVYSAKINN